MAPIERRVAPSHGRRRVHGDVGADRSGAFREVYSKARPIILEPVMRLAVESPGEFQGAVLKTVMQRRGM